MARMQSSLVDLCLRMRSVALSPRSSCCPSFSMRCTFRKAAPSSLRCGLSAGVLLSRPRLASSPRWPRCLSRRLGCHHDRIRGREWCVQVVLCITSVYVNNLFRCSAHALSPVKPCSSAWITFSFLCPGPRFDAWLGSSCSRSSDE